MVKYKVNLKFKDDGKSLNEIITDVLKREIEKRTYMASNTLEVPFDYDYYFQERSMNQNL